MMQSDIVPSRLKQSVNMRHISRPRALGRQTKRLVDHQDIGVLEDDTWHE